jgi:hypothetical protein
MSTTKGGRGIRELGGELSSNPPQFVTVDGGGGGGPAQGDRLVPPAVRRRSSRCGGAWNLRPWVGARRRRLRPRVDGRRWEEAGRRAKEEGSESGGATVRSGKGGNYPSTLWIVTEMLASPLLPGISNETRGCSYALPVSDVNRLTMWTGNMNFKQREHVNVGVEDVRAGHRNYKNALLQSPMCSTSKLHWFLQSNFVTWTPDYSTAWACEPA